MLKPSKIRNFLSADDSLLAVFILIPALVLTIYANSLHGAFVFDDLNVIVTSHAVQSASTLASVFSTLTEWRGLLIFSYALNHYLHGNNVFGYHVVNVLLHIVNTLLVFFIIYKVYPVRVAAFCGALLFASHPLLTSAVASISGRSSLLCATFYFAALLAFLHERYTITALLGALAFHAKQEAIALPVLLVTLLLLTRRYRAAAIITALPAVFIILRYRELSELFHTTLANTDLVTAGFDATLPHPQFFYTYITAVVFYLLPRLALPLQLSVDPDIQTVSHFSLVFVVSCLIIGLLLSLIYILRTKPLLSYGLAALFISPLLAYSIIPLADPVLEHRAYIPALGIALLFSHLIERMRHHVHQFHMTVSIMLVIIGFSAITVYRNRVYRDNFAFWSSGVSSSFFKARPHLNLGYSYQTSGRYNEALTEYTTALTINPSLYAAYSNIASMQIETGQLDAAEANLKNVISLSPQFAEAYINLGVIYLRRGKPSAAIPFFDTALALKSDSVMAKVNRAQAIALLGSKTAF